MFLVSQRDNNAITVVTNELKRVPILAGDFVLEMPPRGNYVDRVVVSSPVHHHTLIGALSPNTRQLYPRSLNRALNLASLVIHQSDDDRVFINHRRWRY
jgi:hypothetical protein